MTTIVVSVVFGFALIALRQMYVQGMCVQCGGRAGHKKDCPWR